MEFDFREWVPSRFRCGQDGVFVDWRFVGRRRRFIEPFFEDSLRRALAEGPKKVRTTQVEALRDYGADAVKPTGFIFHWSRCGSTLVSQMLARIDTHRVISEAPPIDGVLRANLTLPNLAHNDQALWLRWMISALGQGGVSSERHLFIKFDSWHTLDLKLIQETFPTVPWIFIYRDPAEIMVSHQRQRGSHMVPGLIDPAIFGWDRNAVVEMDFDVYGARVLAAVGNAVLQHFDPRRCRLINYTELPQAVNQRVIPFFGLELSRDELELMGRAAQLDAKVPAQGFTADRATKQALVSKNLRAVVDDVIAPVYKRLEALPQSLASR